MNREKIFTLNELQSLQIKIKQPCIIYLRGDLAAGKTTLASYILKDLLGVEGDIISPTYTYYNKYGNHYHFDLYRLSSYDEFFSIGGEDVLDNNTGVILIEWPDVIAPHYKPDIEIILSKTQLEGERKIEIRYT